MTSRRIRIPSAQHTHAQTITGCRDDVADELLNQYPNDRIGSLWTMRVHIKTCEECRFHLHLKAPGDEIPEYILPEGLPNTETVRQLCKWALAGSPADVRRIVETTGGCPHYDPPERSMFEHAQRAERAERARVTPRGPRIPREPRSSGTLGTLGTLGTGGDLRMPSAGLIGPPDSKYILPRPPRREKSDIIPAS
jgi:hypothetical protein